MYIKYQLLIFIDLNYGYKVNHFCDFNNTNINYVDLSSYPANCQISIDTITRKIVDVNQNVKFPLNLLYLVGCQWDQIFLESLKFLKENTIDFYIPILRIKRSEIICRNFKKLRKFARKSLSAHPQEYAHSCIFIKLMKSEKFQLSYSDLPAIIAYEVITADNNIYSKFIGKYDKSVLLNSFSEPQSSGELDIIKGLNKHLLNLKPPEENIIYYESYNIRNPNYRIIGKNPTKKIKGK